MACAVSDFGIHSFSRRRYVGVGRRVSLIAVPATAKHYFIAVPATAKRMLEVSDSTKKRRSPARGDKPAMVFVGR